MVSEENYFEYIDQGQLLIHHLCKPCRALHLQCCILRPKVNGPLVPEKEIFKEFLPFMGMVAIMVI